MSRYWEEVPLDRLSLLQWEMLCDGCGLCCLVKLEDQENGRIRYTRAACEYLDLHDCRCTVYETRRQQAPKCWILSPQNLDRITWLPYSCAYRCLAEKRPLPDWHPLLTEEPQSVHTAGISVKGKAVSELYVHPAQIQEMIADIDV